MKVGILALQGAVGPHEEMLRKLGVEPVQVRTASAFDGLAGIILPGGESTTMLHLLERYQLFTPLQQFVRTHPAWGVCAGAILLARVVKHPEQKSLAAIDITVERNGFGRQLDSFIAPVDATEHWTGKPVEAVFIRAPRITTTGPSVKTLLKWNDEPVCVEEEKRLASTFHPELTDRTALHEYFLSLCEG